MKPIVFLWFLFLFEVSTQNNETIYSINTIATTNEVKLNNEIIYNPESKQQDAYILIRQKSDQTFYIRIDIRGQFGLGGYYKYLDFNGDEYKYERIDGTSEGDIVLVNYPLNTLSRSNQYDQHVIMQMLNYRTSFAIKMKF